MSDKPTIRQTPVEGLPRSIMENIEQEQLGKDITISELIPLVEQWGIDRGIVQNGTPQVQCLKLGSEFGELCDNLAKGRHEAALDDLGDMMVVITLICKQLGTTVEHALNVAYEDIKDRRGYLNEDGIFIKQGDEG